MSWMWRACLFVLVALSAAGFTWRQGWVSALSRGEVDDDPAKPEGPANDAG